MKYWFYWFLHKLGIVTWKNIPHYMGIYQVSTHGRIKSVKTNRIRRPFDRNGYLRIDLWKNNTKKNFSVHQLVALTFLNNYNGYKEVNHKNRIKTDNEMSNLEWCTRKQNDTHWRQCNK